MTPEAMARLSSLYDDVVELREEEGEAGVLVVSGEDATLGQQLRKMLTNPPVPRRQICWHAGRLSRFPRNRRALLKGTASVPIACSGAWAKVGWARCGWPSATMDCSSAWWR